MKVKKLKAYWTYKVVVPIVNYIHQFKCGWRYRRYAFHRPYPLTSHLERVNVYACHLVPTAKGNPLQRARNILDMFDQSQPYYKYEPAPEWVHRSEVA